MIKCNGNNADSIILQLKHIILDKGIKQRDIVDKTGWSKQTVSNLLAGRTGQNGNINIATLYMLCNALDCDLYIDIVPRDKDKSKSITEDKED